MLVFDANAEYHIAYGDAVHDFVIPMDGFLEDGAVPDLDKIALGLDQGCNYADIDIFGLVFFYLSRYEEYNYKSIDVHGRFMAKDSLSSDVVQLPIVEYIINYIGQKLNHLYPTMPAKIKFGVNESTLDIDQTWAFANKGLKGFLGIVRDIFLLRIYSLKMRWQSYMNADDDPFFTFPYIIALHYKLSLKPRFFVLASSNQHSFDVNHRIDNINNKIIIKNLSEKYELGIHPSYYSNFEPTEIKIEINRLESTIGKKISTSRQHFLKMNLPNTYQRLIDAGITDDYTMGYADKIGYRAGTGHSFYWYDLNREMATGLMIHPFQIMDVTLKHYMRLSTAEATIKCEALCKEAKKFGTPIRIIWHNSSLGNYGDWSDWRHVYESILSQICSKNPIA
jgi:hypothetical protein